MSLYVITMNGCGGCEKFKKNMHPTLNEKLKGKIKYNVVEKSETSLIPDFVKPYTTNAWFPMLVYKNNKGNVHVFNGVIVGDKVVYKEKYKWSADDILKWLCNSSMDDTNIVCQFTNDGSIKVLINNPLIDLS